MQLRLNTSIDPAARSKEAKTETEQTSGFGAMNSVKVSVKFSLTGSFKLDRGDGGR